ncbi:hypothetical protein KAX22_05495 [bacterium]|nr:hypothetical protein [bacterium]
MLEESIPAEEYVDLNTVLMESTFRLQGVTAQDSVLIGTVFIFDIPCQGCPSKVILVASAHLLDSMVTDRALLSLRNKKWDGRWEEHPWWIEVCHDGRQTL